MKKIAPIIVVIFSLIMTTPTVAAQPRSFQQRVAEIEVTYGMTVSYDETGETLAASQLTQIERALADLGPAFIREMARHYAQDTEDGALHILITADENWESIDVGGTFSILDNTIELYVRTNAVIPAANIVHEFGHVYHWYLGADSLDEFCEINGGKKGYVKTIFDPPFDATRYVDPFAATKVSEDFAETFMMMIVNGGDKPTAIREDTILYRKFQWLQGSLVEKMGADNLTTQRASAFLGIPPEED